MHYSDFTGFLGTT